jgi:hypothetical protein
VGNLRDPSMAFRWVLHRTFMWYLERVMGSRCPTCKVERGYCVGAAIHPARSMEFAKELVAFGKQAVSE